MKLRDGVMFAASCLCLLGLTRPALGYELEDYRWPTPSTRIDVDIPAGGSDPQWNRAFDEAAARWNSASMFEFEVNRRRTSPCASDNRNGVGFRSDVCDEAFGDLVLAVTLTLINARTNRTTEADIVFNSNEMFDVYNGPASAGASDFRRVAVHELGHVIGLAHVENALPSIMEPSESDVEYPQLTTFAASQTTTAAIRTPCLASAMRETRWSSTSACMHL